MKKDLSLRTRQVALIVGALSVVGMGLTAGCSTKESPSTPTAPSSSGVDAKTKPPSPSRPSSGPNSYAPQVTAKPAPTALPGNVVTGGN